MVVVVTLARFMHACQCLPCVSLIPRGRGHFHWRPYQMLEKKGGKGIQLRGGRGSLGTRKGCQNHETWEKGYPNRFDQNSRHAIIPGKGR